ncbi:hypothetical protein BpHYR1_015930 [Brachionus plicatilis]|uniref:Uncharacterized protein n=1 Tax=Brachionus plicatilis TaxID=10195 RepID=A0A3M7S691_BRAPC|nr:hypothetical protein BpHYR1_015930 [Brachionus plicatilis]
MTMPIKLFQNKIEIKKNKQSINHCVYICVKLIFTVSLLTIAISSRTKAASYVSFEFHEINVIPVDRPVLIYIYQVSELVKLTSHPASIRLLAIIDKSFSLFDGLRQHSCIAVRPS